MADNQVRLILKSLNDDLDNIGPQMETHSRRGYIALKKLDEKLKKYSDAIAGAVRYISPEYSKSVIDAGNEYISILEEYGEAQAAMADDTKAVTDIVVRALGLLATLAIIEEYGNDTSLG